MKATVNNFKKIFLNSLIIIVSLLVIFAFYSSRDKFSGVTTIKYTKIQLNDETSIAQIAEKYTEPENVDRFIAEVKRVNGIESSGIFNEKNLMIPVFKSN